MSQRIRGVLAPVVTPFKDDLSPYSKRFIAHCKWLLSQNCGLAIFGTNSEANSLSMEERALLLDELVAAGVDPAIGDRSLFGDRVRFVVPADSLQLRDNKFPARICFGRHERNQRFYPLN